jgi:hypothetical protein
VKAPGIRRLERQIYGNSINRHIASPDIGRIPNLASQQKLGLLSERRAWAGACDPDRASAIGVHLAGAQERRFISERKKMERRGGLRVEKIIWRRSS